MLFATIGFTNKGASYAALLEIVPDFMRNIRHFSPVTWAMDGFHALLFNSGGLLVMRLYVGGASELIPRFPRTILLILIAGTPMFIAI